MKVRFAPSPTGRIHLGNARTALFNWLMAIKAEGTFLLRYDDTDAERSTREFADAIAGDLEWLGVRPDQTVRQSERRARHAAAADRLRDAGLLYPCYETADELDRKRKRLLARGLPPVYDRAALKLSSEDHERNAAEGRTPHWRFLLPNHGGDPFAPVRTERTWNDLFVGPQHIDLASMSDPVLVREDNTYLYTLPSVVDDAELGVTHVVRGADHIANTAVQIAIFEALDYAIPVFGHHNLLAAADGGGLSKRDGALSLGDLADAGYEPEAVAACAVLTGTSEPVRALPLSELASTFEPGIVSASPARFDPNELNGVNERFLHDLSFEEASSRSDVEFSEPLWMTVRANLEKLGDIATWRAIVHDGPDVSVPEKDRAFLATAAELAPSDWSDPWSEWTKAIKDRTGRKGRTLFMPLRLALTGLDHGPELGPLVRLIGREETIRRLS